MLFDPAPSQDIEIFQDRVAKLKAELDDWRPSTDMLSSGNPKVLLNELSNFFSPMFAGTLKSAQLFSSNNGRF
jgi:hypothetical protein